MAKLNQIIAIEKGIKSATHSLLSEWYKLIQKPELFAGFEKKYQRMNEESEELPADQKRVQMGVVGLLRQVRTAMVDLWSVTARKEWTNSQARAPVRVAGVAMTTALPVTYLLFLEKQLTDLRTLVAHVPVLEIAEDWHVDLATGLYRTEPVLTHRTKKVQRPLVLYPATPEHPAQTQLITEDVLAGYWSTIKYSGALPLQAKEALAARIEAAVRAVKEAREEANSCEEVANVDSAARLLEWLFTPESFPAAGREEGTV
jgi:hypothetical protein